MAQRRSGLAWRRLARRGRALAAALTLAGSAMAQAPATPPRADVTYAGSLPCAGCSSQQVVLTLFGDHTFRMRTRRVDARPGTAAEVYDLGRWGTEGTLRVLRGGREAPWLYLVDDDGALRPLDARGEPVAAAAGTGRLLRQAEVDRLPGPTRLRGMYRYLADAASLDECRTGKRWPVLIDGEHLALERAYLAQRTHPDQAVLAAFSASFELREPEPGLPPREVLRVRRFEQLWPRETCAADALARAPLLNTRWRVVEVDGQPVIPGPGAREPYLLFAAEGNRVRGFGGCNNLAGRFEQGADGLRVLDLAAQRQACAATVGEQERQLLQVLRATATQSIDGDALQLRDDEGRLRLRAEALYLR